jgi:4,5-DOPA dioxygenase extradiol
MSDNLMPVVFIGHGSPTNAIENNIFTEGWKKIAGQIPKPKAILAVSAHWYTNGTKIMDEPHPKMIYDMYGFPEELYRIVYDSDGDPELAHQIKKLISKETSYDNSWGYDHGTWSILKHIYPDRDIPVLQLSVDRNAPPEVHFEIGRQLRSLRENGVLILGSGNIVHNLRAVDWSLDGGYDWAYEFDGHIKNSILNKDFTNVINYKKAENSAKAVPTPDHFYPLLYVLGAADESDEVSIYNDGCVLGSMSMTSYLFYHKK